MRRNEKASGVGKSGGGSSIAESAHSGMLRVVATMTMNQPKLGREALEKIAGVFRVFSEPTRLQILQELKGGGRNVTELVEALGSSQANVSKQLRILHDGGVVSRSRKGTQVIYAIADPLTFEMCNLVCQKLNREANAPQPNFAL